MFLTVVLIILAFLLFCLIILVHEFGHFFTAKLCGIRVNEFALGMGPKLFQWKRGETVYSIRLLPIGGFCAMEGENGTSDDPRAFVNKAAWKRIIVVSAGAAMNIILGFVMMFIVVVQQPVYTSTTIAAFEENALTESSGLQVGDTFYSIDGYRTYTTRDMTFALSIADANDINMTVVRDGEQLTFEHLRLKSSVVDGKIYPRVDFKVFPIERTFGNVITRTFTETASFTRMVWSSLGAIVTGKVGISSLSGPIGTASAITQVAASGNGTDWVQGINNILLLMIIITINLGIINLLPLPALDGGRLLFLIIELIRRKPINQKYEGWIHTAGFIALMLFMVLISIQDILHIFQ